MSYDKNKPSKFKNPSMRFHYMYGVLSIFCALCGIIASTVLLAFGDYVWVFIPTCFACFFWGLTGSLLIGRKQAGLALMRVKSFVEALLGVAIAGSSIYITVLCLDFPDSLCRYGLILGLTTMVVSILPIAVGIATPRYYDNRYHLFR